MSFDEASSIINILDLLESFPHPNPVPFDTLLSKANVRCLILNCMTYNDREKWVRKELERFHEDK